VDTEEKGMASESAQARKVAPILKTLPNVVSFSRVVIALVVTMLAWSHGFSYAFLLWLIGAAFTDWVDGRLARHLDVHGGFGQEFDPICDKVGIGIVGILAIRLMWGSWAVAIVAALLALELAISIQALHAKYVLKYVIRVTFNAKMAIAVRAFGMILLFWSVLVSGENKFTLVVLGSGESILGIFLGWLVFFGYRKDIKRFKSSSAQQPTV
jgi:phosphatidylglycerophosphate synthase